LVFLSFSFLLVCHLTLSLLICCRPFLSYVLTTVIFSSNVRYYIWVQIVIGSNSPVFILHHRSMDDWESTKAINTLLIDA
jgi:hypothetical protein